MKFLKVANPMWAGYTGPLGNQMFVDGVSANMLPRHERDRLAASMEFIEFGEDGVEMIAGRAHRMVIEAEAQAPILEPSEIQTEEERERELQESTREVIAPELLTKEMLQKLADDQGIKGLREIAGQWSAKDRSIPSLIEKILEKQSRYMQLRNQKVGIVDDEADSLPPEIIALIERKAAELPPVPEDQVDLIPDENLAAAIGDLSAALNAQEV